MNLPIFHWGRGEPDKGPAEAAQVPAPTPGTTLTLIKDQAVLDDEAIEAENRAAEDRAAEDRVVEDEAAASRARAALTPYVERPLLPPVRRMWESTRWWGRAAGRLGTRLALHPWLPLTELRPIWSGLVHVASGWQDWVTAKEQTEHIRKGESGDMKIKGGHYNEIRKAGRMRLSLLCAAIVAGAALYLYLSGRGMVLVGAMVAAVALLDAVGRKLAGDKPPVAPTLPKSALGLGTPLHLLAEIIADTLIAFGHVPTVAEGKIIKHGVSFQVHSAMPVDNDQVDAVERALQGFRGSVKRIPRKDNAAVNELQWMIEDPLDKRVVPPTYLPLSQDVNDPADMGLGWTGQKLLIGFLRTNMAVVGKPGSGKTSLASSMVDYVTACRNARASCIDLSGGPFGFMWGSGFYRHAVDVESAKDLLREALDLARKRTRQIGDRARPRLDAIIGSENWEPDLDGGPQYSIFVDEAAMLSGDAELLELLAELLRIGRKAAVNVIMMSQGFDGDTVGKTSLRKYVSTIFLLACNREDVSLLIGGGMIDLGWTPHRLVPAEGATVNDAGKCYVWGGGNSVPLPWRVPRLDNIADVHRRALQREAAGWPCFEFETGAATGVVHEAIEVPPLLAAVERVFAELGDPEKIGTLELLAVIKARGFGVANASALAAGLRPHLAPRDERWFDDSGKKIKGYFLADVREAIRRLS